MKVAAPEVPRKLVSGPAPLRPATARWPPSSCFRLGHNRPERSVPRGPAFPLPSRANSDPVTLTHPRSRAGIPAGGGGAGPRAGGGGDWAEGRWGGAPRPPLCSPAATTFVRGKILASFAGEIKILLVSDLPGARKLNFNPGRMGSESHP